MTYEKTYLLAGTPGHLLHLGGIALVFALLQGAVAQGGHVFDGWTGEILVSTEEILVTLLFLACGVVIKGGLLLSAQESKRVLALFWGLNLLYLIGWGYFWWVATGSDPTAARSPLELALIGALIPPVVATLVRLHKLMKPSPAQR